MRKYIRPQKCAFSDIFGPDLTCRVIAFCMVAICHMRKFGQVLGPQLPYQKSQENWCPLDLRLPNGRIVSSRQVTGRYILGVLYGENMPKSENWATSTSRSSTTICCTENLPDLGNSLALGLQRGVNHSPRTYDKKCHHQNNPK